MQITDLIELGKLLKNHSATFEVSYGSGGFCVIIKTNTGKVYNSYSWAITDAAGSAFKKLIHDDPDFNFDDDEPTKPDIRDTTYKIINH